MATKRAAKSSNPLLAIKNSSSGYAKKTARKSSSSKPKRSKKAKKFKHPYYKFFAAFFCVIFLFLVLFVVFGKKGHKGIDVSHHQGKIDWPTVVNDGGVEFAYIKATEGVNHIDKNFKKNKQGARDAGIPVGFYHFFRADKPGEKQFKNFQENIGMDFDLIPVLDLEDMGGKIKDKKKYQAEVQAFIDSFFDFYGYYPIVYGSHPFMKDNVYPVAKECDYWLAWYLSLSKVIHDKRRFLNAARPRLHARMWQYSEKGKLPGIKEFVDLDECWELEDIKVK